VESVSDTLVKFAAKAGLIGKYKKANAKISK
jgi:hypothetical protein